MAKKQPEREQWKNRIIGHGVENPEQILANPANYRVHPARQQKMMEGILDKVGYVQNVIVNQRTGHLIDGHMRVTLALRKGEKEIPVVYVDLDEQEEATVLATLDPVGSLAKTDQDMLDSLIETMGDSAALAKQVTENLNLFDPDKRIEKPKIEYTGESVELVADPVFQSENKYGIPDMLEDMLADELPTVVWPDSSKEENAEHWYFNFSSTAIEQAAGKTIAFNRNDDFFTQVWNDPIGFTRKLLAIEPAAVCAPDFSIYGDYPMAVTLWNVYRRQWLARYWQGVGIKVAPTLNMVYPDSYDYCLAGIPKGAPYLMWECRSPGSNKDDKSYALQQLHDGVDILKPHAVVIYGGLEHQEWLRPNLPANVEVVLLTS